MTWRDHVRSSVLEIIREWNETAQVLHAGHIKELADLIMDGIPSPDNEER